MKRIHLVSLLIFFFPFWLAKSCDLYNPTTWDISLGGQNLGGSGVRAKQLNHDAFTRTTDIAKLSNPSYSGSGLLTPRRDHTATLLLDGRVLIVGGENNSTPVAEAEIYDQGSGEFQKAASLNTARMRHTATLLSNGRVIIAGGQDSQFSPLQSLEEYDPTTDTFKILLSLLNEPRYAHTATLFPSDGVIAFVGGFKNNSNQTPEATNSVDFYDPGQPPGSRIVAGPPLPDTRAHHSATLIAGVDKIMGTSDDELLVAYGIGTSVAGNPPQVTYILRRKFYVLDRRNNQWVSTATGNAARWGHHALQTYNANFDVIILAGIAATQAGPYTGPPGGSPRDDGLNPVGAVEVYRSTSTPSGIQGVILTPQNVQQIPPPMQPFVGGSGSVATSVVLDFGGPTRTYRLVFIGAGVFWQTNTRVYSQNAYLINVTDANPNNWSIRLVGQGFSAVQGAPPSSPPGPNPAPGTLTSPHAFSAISRLPGPDGYAGTADDTLLICGGQEAGPTQIQYGDVYTFPIEANMP